MTEVKTVDPNPPPPTPGDRSKDGPVTRPPVAREEGSILVPTVIPPAPSDRVTRSWNGPTQVAYPTGALQVFQTGVTEQAVFGGSGTGLVRVLGTPTTKVPEGSTLVGVWGWNSSREVGGVGGLKAPRVDRGEVSTGRLPGRPPRSVLRVPLNDPTGVGDEVGDLSVR